MAATVNVLSQETGAGSATPASAGQAAGPFLCIVYVSAATPGLSTGDLEALLEQSRRRNRRLGITGLLIHADGNFIQALEGPEAAVLEVFGAIEADRRHGGVTPLLRQGIDHRRFPEWAMAYRDLRSAKGGNWDAVDRILEAVRSNGQAADLVPVALLARFRQTMGVASTD